MDQQWNQLQAGEIRHDVVRRTPEEISAVMDQAADLVEDTGRQPGFAPLSQWSYAAGVSDGISWLLGQSEDNPREKF